MKLLTFLSSNDIVANILNLNSNLTDHVANIKQNNYSTLGVSLQYDCQQSDNIINEVSILTRKKSLLIVYTYIYIFND